MTEGIVVGILSLIGVIISNIVTSILSNKQMDNKLSTNQAVMETKIDQLTKEVNKHNNFAGRIPVIEEQIKTLQEKVKELEDK